MNAYETAHHIANTSFFPNTPSELAIIKEEYENLGFEVVICTPVDEIDFVETPTRERPKVYLCGRCGRKHDTGQYCPTCNAQLAPF